MRQGFTTIELMVTLFVAAMFIVSGYQLYSVINTRSSNSRMMSEASSLGYEVLRKEGAYESVSTLCSSSSAHPTQSITRTGIKLPELSIEIQRCRPFPYNTAIRVTSIVKYGNPIKEVRHAIYVSQ